jgi:excisionase family DNA binding protein
MQHPLGNLMEVLTIDDLSYYLRIPKSTLYKLVQEGKVPCQKVGRHWRFRKEVIDRWLEDPKPFQVHPEEGGNGGSLSKGRPGLKLEESRVQKEPNREETMVDFDRQFLLEQLDGDKEVVKEILNLYLEKTPEQIGAVAEAVKNKDAALIRSSAHSLKGSSGNVGAVKLSQTAQKMETIGKEGDLSRAEELMKEIEENFRTFQGALQHLGFDEPVRGEN